MEKFFEQLRTHLAENPLSFGDAESALGLLYEIYSESNKLDDRKIQADFDELYQVMNGMTLEEMDRIIYPLCTLCRDHERSGFVEGVKVGILLRDELAER